MPDRLGDAHELVLPRLTFPVPAKLHPDVDELEDETLAWLRRFGVIRDDDDERYLRHSTLGRTYAWMIPEGSTERVLLATQFCIWATVQDDRYTETLGLQQRPTELARHLLACEAIAENPHAPLPARQPPIEHAYRDLFLRVERWGTPNQVLRIRKGMLHYSVGAAADAAYATRQIAPRVRETFAAMAERMADWARTGFTIADIRDLDRYTYAVSGTLVLLLSDLWSWFDGTRSDRGHGIGYGRALQSANILLNRGTDLGRGVDFWPTDWRAADMLGYIRTELTAARQYVTALPPDGPAYRFCRPALDRYELAVAGYLADH